MGKRTPRTFGLDWLIHSMNAFNGSGYADKAAPENFIESFRAYKTWKKQTYALEMLETYETEAFEAATRLCHARDAGHTPTFKKLAEFSRYYDPDRIAR